jgi:hypothetical protein
MRKMKNLLKLEELSLLLLAIYLFSRLDYAWWWFAVLFLAPDLGMIGYAAGPRVGALTYNLLHHKGVAIGCYLIGVMSGSQLLQLVGLIMLAHASFDRILGYGLKYADAFTHTHLGMIGPTATH